MKRVIVIPADTPAAACGRCLWFNGPLTTIGRATCIYWRERRHYKSMVCDEYEVDTEKITGA